MNWFKFYGQEYLSDPKILSLTASERSCWITLLSYASIDGDGDIKYLSEHRLKMQSGLDPIRENWKETDGILEKFVKLGMITLDNDVITIVNWRKRQEKSLTPYERVKRFREKKRNDNGMITDDNDDDNAMITTDKIREDKIREDKNRINNNSELGSQVKEIMNIFYRINPTLNWGNKTTRGACEFLIKKFTFPETKKLAELAVSVQGKPYAPTITTPYQLKEKLSALGIFLKRDDRAKVVEIS